MNAGSTATTPRATTDDGVMRETLLQEAVSCAIATLYAIEAGDMFRDLPADERAKELHGHGCWLLGMLEDQLTRLQQQVDGLSRPTAPEA